MSRHGCPSHLASDPRAFRLAKITGNKASDRGVNRALLGRGWTVVRIWEHELAKKNIPKLLKRLQPLFKP